MTTPAERCNTKPLVVAPKELEDLWPEVRNGWAVYSLGTKEISVSISTAAFYEANLRVKREMLFHEFSRGAFKSDLDRSICMQRITALVQIAQCGAARANPKVLILEGTEFLL